VQQLRSSLGEAAALRVRNVDFLRRRIALEQNAVMVGARVEVGSLKGYKNRVVPLPSFVGDEIAKVCAGKTRDDLLWTTAHDLRHTAASLAVSAGANVKAVQRMLGQVGRPDA
jgi:integrase